MVAKASYWPDYGDTKTMTGSDDTAPLHIDTEAFLSNTAGREGGGLAMDMIMCIWWPEMRPFEWGDDIAQRLNQSLPGRGYTVESVRQLTPSAQTFFEHLPNGTWAPSPQFFSVTSGNPGAES